MYRHKKVTALLLMQFIFAGMLMAQTVNVQRQSQALMGESVDGYGVAIDAPVAEVQAAFNKYLKAIGKVRPSGENQLVNEPTLNGVSYTHPLVATVKPTGKSGSLAWIGAQPSLWTERELQVVNADLEKIMKDFGVKFYRDKIQVQVDESTRAQQAVEKQQQRLQNESKLLAAKLEDNKREKLQLEKSLQNNALTYEELLKKIERNKHAQDSVAQTGEQVKKMVEAHRERQRKVN